MGRTLARGIGNLGGQMKGRSTQHRVFALEQGAKPKPILHIQPKPRHAGRRAKPIQLVLRFVGQGHPVVAGGGQHFRHGGADFPSADDDDVFHDFPPRIVFIMAADIGKSQEHFGQFGLFIWSK